MKSGEELHQDHPQYAAFMQILAGVPAKHVKKI
jgi:hypothetical protein